MEHKQPDFWLRQAQHLADDIKELEAIDVKRAYRDTRQRIAQNRRKRWSERLVRVAAVLAVPLLLTSLTLGYLAFHADEEVVRYAQVRAAQGTIVRYELPDKSVVWLNAGSELSFPTVFDDAKREVALKGEAYFEVTADKEHPFYVHTPAGPSVYVYGTKFNVSAYADEGAMETVLEEGKVNVLTADRKVVTLSPGERLLYDKTTQRMLKGKADVYEKTAWKEGKLIFRNTPLDEVLKRLSRHFNVTMTFHNHSGKEYHYRATFRDETLPQILDYLGESASLKWRMEETVKQADDSFSKKSIIIDLY